jgi:hypothetical protein
MDRVFSAWCELSCRLLYFVFAVLAVKLYGNVMLDHTQCMDEHANFSTFGVTQFDLLRNPWLSLSGTLVAAVDVDAVPHVNGRGLGLHCA